MITTENDVRVTNYLCTWIHKRIPLHQGPCTELFKNAFKHHYIVLKIMILKIQVFQMHKRMFPKH